MAYQIYNADGTLFATINDGTINTASSMTLVGKNWAGYGAYIDTNFLHLLQHFSSATPPATPITGQIWWNSSSKVLNAWDGAMWRQFHSSYTGGSAPANPAVGDLWFDTVSGTLKAWDGSKWVTIGPSFVNGTGAISDIIIDTVSSPHNVIKLMVNNNVAGVISQDTFIPASPIYGFSSIKPGINMSCNIGGYGNVGGFNGCYVSVTGDVWANTGHFNNLDVAGPFNAANGPGTPPQVLTSQGPGQPPIWKTWQSIMGYTPLDVTQYNNDFSNLLNGMGPLNNAFQGTGWQKFKGGMLMQWSGGYAGTGTAYFLSLPLMYNNYLSVQVTIGAAPPPLDGKDYGTWTSWAPITYNQVVITTWVAYMDPNFPSWTPGNLGPATWVTLWGY